MGPSVVCFLITNTTDLHHFLSLQQTSTGPLDSPEIDCFSLLLYLDAKLLPEVWPMKAQFGVRVSAVHTPVLVNDATLATTQLRFDFTHASILFYFQPRDA